MSTRRRGREVVLKALYAFEQGEQSQSTILEAVMRDGGLDEKTLGFARTLFEQVANHIKEIDEYIENLATNWKIDRIAIVDKNILRMAIGEIRYMPDIPLKVAINEAVELAKKYSTFESAAFVNGILDRVIHEKGK